MTTSDDRQSATAGVASWRLTFRVRHSSADLSGLAAGIADAFDEEPLHVVRAGERRRTPTGRVLDVLADESVVSVRWNNTPGRIEHALEDAMDALAPLTGALAAILTDGGRLEFFTGLFVERSLGVVFPPALLARMAGLGIELQLDIYGGPERSE